MVRNQYSLINVHRDLYQYINTSYLKMTKNKNVCANKWYVPGDDNWEAGRHDRAQRRRRFERRKMRKKDNCRYMWEVEQQQMEVKE